MVIPAILVIGAVLLGTGIVLDAPAPSWLSLGLAVAVAALCLAAPEAEAGTGPAAADPEQPDAEPRDAAAEVDDVWVIHGRRRFHTAECPVLVGQSGAAYRRDEARAAGFSPCSRCAREGATAAVSREPAQ